MGTPKKRSSQPKTKTKKRLRKKAKKSEFFIPERTNLDLKELSGGQDDLSFYSLVGHTNLDPYAWISLDNENEFSDFYNYFSVRRGKKPNVAGIVSLVYKNEYKKFPTVEFEFTEPDYRKLRVESSIGGGGSEFTKKFTSKRIEKLKYGKVFYIRFGYVSSHVQYGPFTIIETDLKFEQGTAICKIKGRLGHKLRSVSSVKYFSNTSPFDIVNQMANLTGLRINTKDLLEDELEEMRQERIDVSSQENVGKLQFDVANKMGFDLYYNPQDNSLHFESPFKLELLNKGKKPYKMSYGFPSSSIDEIEVKVHRPKKRRRPTGGKLPMTHGKKKNEVLMLEKKARSLIHGVIKTDLGTIVPLSSYSLLVYVQEGVETPAGNTPVQGTKEYLEETYKNSDNIQYQIEKSGIVLARQKKEFYNIYAIVKTGEELEQEIITVNGTQNLQKEVGDPNQIITDVSQIKETGIDQYSVTILRKRKKLKKGSKAKSQSSSVLEGKITDTIDIDNKRLTKIGEVRFKNKIDIDSVYQETNLPDSQRSRNIKAYRKLKRREAQLNKVSGNYVRIIPQDKTRFALYSYLDERGNPFKDSLIYAEEDGDDKQAFEYVPAAKNKPKTLVSRQIRSRAKVVGKRKELKITLRAGDWTMECGRLIELTDVYHEYRGYYYVYSVEHEIGSDGFHTKIGCRVASKRLVNNANNPNTVQGTRKNKAKEAQSPERRKVKVYPVRKLTPADQRVIKEQEKGQFDRLTRERLRDEGILSSDSFEPGKIY